MKTELLFENWEKSTPERLKSDPLWKSMYYRLAMYLFELVWLDSAILHQDFRGREISRQIIRSSGSICANVEEAYGRGVGTADYLRIIRIALGEARETKGWYFRSRQILPHDLLERRLDIVDHVIALLARNLSQQRRIISKS
jgi:four helix bundle protein